MTVKIKPPGWDEKEAGKENPRKSVPAGVGFAMGIILGAGIGLALKNVALGVGVGVVFALSLETVFRVQREKDGN